MTMFTSGSGRWQPGWVEAAVVNTFQRLRHRAPVLRMTGYPLDVEEGEATDGGVSGVLLKPFTMQRLAEALRAALNP